MKSGAKYDTKDKPPREEGQKVTEQCILKCISKRLLMHGADDGKQGTSLAELEQIRHEKNKQLRKKTDQLRQKARQINVSFINVFAKDQDKVFYCKY